MVDNHGARYPDNPIPLVKYREYPFIVLRMVAGFAPNYGPIMKPIKRAVLIHRAPAKTWKKSSPITELLAIIKLSATMTAPATIRPQEERMAVPWPLYPWLALDAQGLDSYHRLQIVKLNMVLAWNINSYTMHRWC
jgi:hypothetical protein